MHFYRIEHITKVCQNLEITLQLYQTLFPDWFICAQEAADDSSWIHFGNHLGNYQFYLSLCERRNRSQFITLNTGNIDRIGIVIEEGKKMMALLDAHGIK